MLALFKSTDEATAWVMTSAVAFTLAVLCLLKANAVKAVVDYIQKLLFRLARLAVGRPGNADSLADDAARTAVQNLARRLSKRIERESIHLKLKAPRPLKVSWREVSAYGGPVSSPGLDGVLDEIKTVFDKVRARIGERRPGRLVILGPGGSGKSVLLQCLALKMLEDPGTAGPVPVIFNLRSWEEGMALDDWLTAQLLRLRYDPGLREEAARSIVANRLVLPLLDGFDEIGEDGRADLLDLLNRDAGREMVLTSRREEYMGTVRGRNGSNGTVLSGAAVIELTDLPLEEATKYLRGLPSPRTRHGGVESAWEPVTRKLLLQRRPAAARRLAEVFTKPLMVAIARDVYRYEDPADLLDDTTFTSVEEVENHLLDNFIPAIYDEKAENSSRWGTDKALRAFGYLASRLGPPDDDGTYRQDIAWWEIGTAGMTPLKRSVLSGLAGGLVTVFAVGITDFTAFVLGYRPTGISPVLALMGSSGDIMMVALAFGLVHRLTIKYKRRLLEPSRASIKLFGRPGGGRRGQRRMRDVTRRFRGGLAFGGIAGFAGVFTIFAYSVVMISLWGGEPLGIRGSIVDYTLLMLASVLGIALVTGITAGFFALLEVPAEAEAVGPLALLAANRRITVLAGLAVALMSGAVTGILFGLPEGFTQGIGSAAVSGITLGAGCVICVTAWGQWVLFCRIWLPLTGKLPWRTRAFLDDAHKRGVLRQIGCVYQFRHARLQARILLASERLLSAERPPADELEPTASDTAATEVA